MISVIIPAYNVEKYIERTLKSVQNQSYKDIEIIVINDGSTDRTLEIINKNKNKNLRIFNIKNSGPSKARNIGLENAIGNYIFFLDGDDWIETRTLENLKREFQKEDVDLVACNYYEDNDLGKLIKRKEGIRSELNLLERDKILENFFEGNLSAAVWNKLYKKSFLNENSIRFSEELLIAEDIEFMFKVYYYAKKIKLYDEFLLHYIKNPNSITKKDKSLKMKYVFNSVEKIEIFYDKKIPEKFKVKYIIQFIYFEYLSNNECYSKLCKQFFDFLLEINRKSLYEMYNDNIISKNTLIFCLVNKKIKNLNFFKWSLNLKNKVY